MPAIERITSLFHAPPLPANRPCVVKLAVPAASREAHLTPVSNTHSPPISNRIWDLNVPSCTPTGSMGFGWGFVCLEPNADHEVKVERLRTEVAPLCSVYWSVSMHKVTQSFKNRLLELCDEGDIERLSTHLEPVTLEYKRALYEPNEPIEWVYFPTSGVVSLVITMNNGSAAEVGTVGNEGMVGVPLLLGDDTTPASAYVQVPGAGLRLRASILANELRRSAMLRETLLRYVHAVLNQIALTAACNALHSVEQRCCRWFLMTHDRVQSEKFLLTQEFLGMMLGVQRTTVTSAAAALRKRGIVDYRRGEVTILNRQEIEKCSCECYAVAKREFDRLLGPPLGQTRLPPGSAGGMAIPSFAPSQPSPIT
jgi:CRP-like cAMP-binding protein